MRESDENYVVVNWRFEYLIEGQIDETIIMVGSV